MSKKTKALLYFLGSLFLCLVASFLIDTYFKSYPALSLVSGFVAVIIAGMAFINLGMKYTEGGGGIM